jgi:hypothetical protein
MKTIFELAYLAVIICLSLYAYGHFKGEIDRQAAVIEAGDERILKLQVDLERVRRDWKQWCRPLPAGGE